MRVHVALYVGFVVGCVDTPRLHEPVVEQSSVAIVEVYESPQPRLDLLIVVDDTTAMAPYLEHVAAMPAQLSRAIDAVAGGWTDLRIAVTTTGGELRRVHGVAEPFLVHALEYNYTRRANYPGALEDALSELLDVGAARTAPSQLLAAQQIALDALGWRSDEASLAIVLVAASDDASPLSSDEYVAALRARGYEFRIAVSRIQASGSPRLDTFSTALRSRKTHALDAGEYGDAFQEMGNALFGFGLSICRGDELDLDRTVPGLQYDCAMSALVDGVRRVIPECPAPLPIETRAADATHCTAPSEPCWTLRDTTREPCGCYEDLPYQLRLRGYTAFSHPALRFECRTN